MSDAFPMWAQLLYNEVLAISEWKNEVLCQLAEARLTGGSPPRLTAQMLDGPRRASAEESSYFSDGQRKSFASKDGIAVIRAYGTTVKRGGFMDADSGLLGYDLLLRQVRAASHDPDIRGTFLMIDSPGGHVSRLFETANEIAMLAKAEGGKPIFAYLDEQCCSAAYVLASATDRILAPRSAVAGCLGAMMNVIDVSRLYEKAGIEPYVIRSEWADLKAGPQPGERMSAELLAGYQRLVADASDQMLEFLTAMRPLSEQAIKDMRGEVFSGADLIRLNLADDIVSEREAWSMLLDEAASA